MTNANTTSHQDMRDTDYYNHYKSPWRHGLHLERLHNPSSRITRSQTDHGGRRSNHKDGILYQFKLKPNRKRCGQHILTRSVETSRSTHQNYFGYGCQVFRGILGVVIQVARHQTKRCLLHITPKPMARRKERTKRWKNTYAISSITTRRTRISYYH